jgi:hypothetical protein
MVRERKKKSLVAARNRAAIPRLFSCSIVTVSMTLSWRLNCYGKLRKLGPVCFFTRLTLEPIAEFHEICYKSHVINGINNFVLINFLSRVRGKPVKVAERQGALLKAD